MESVRYLSKDAAARLARVQSACSAPLAGLAARDRDLFAVRLARWFAQLDEGLNAVYGRAPGYEELLERVVVTLAEQHTARPEALRLLDIERDLTPDWFQRENMVGYVFYVGRFASDLLGVLDHLDYLEEIGVTYVHVMSVLRPREGENDGGYAIADYLDVDPRIGTRADLLRVCAALRERGIACCVDLVINHCADTHPWARAAMAGEEHYRGYFHTFMDRSEPDAYERTLLEIFPDFAPGNFTFVPEMGRWVWTTFHRYQWDLNWTNPEVFLEVLRIMGTLANWGVEVFRLDAVAFMWKRLGSNCQNQSEVHDLLQALRACSKIATPAVAHKAEAIVAPGDLIHYFGTGRRYGKVANIAYHNSLMVQAWSALATRDARLMSHTLRAYPPAPPAIAWGTYLRCHDDIGWAITDEDAAAVGLSGPAHRHFLSDFYAGEFPGSFARGIVFQHNPATGDRRISGSAASLAGLESALEAADQDAVDLAVERLLWLHALMAGYGGIPLVYMGDELGLRSDHRYLRDPELRDDNRWAHRPVMDWGLADRRLQPGTLEARIFAGVVGILRSRAGTPQLHAQTPSEVLACEHPQLFAQLRRHPLGPLLGLYNVSDTPIVIETRWLRDLGLATGFDQLGQRFVDLAEPQWTLAPYARHWLV
jgi:amylosucrase